ncbi:MAG: Coenzyme F420 hydrogenase/dehydrogenase, beta subunit C-terminal domain [Syntrophomonas sp.]
MIDNLDKNMCTGCSACYCACPCEAIEMKVDGEGFWHPEIDKDLCNECDICSDVCPVINKLEKSSNFSVPKVFAVWSLDENVRLTSTSGGFFTELAKVVIAQQGYVAGARYNEGHLVEHHIVNDVEGLSLLKQSKYIQSDVGRCYEKIRDLLESDSYVLFCGTPCQAAGLQSYLGRDYDKLILCDFICRGVNSPKVYVKYLEMLQSRYGSTVKKVTFKFKGYGWNRFSTLIEFEDGRRYIKDRYHDPYMLGYIEHNYYMRPSCHNCTFKRLPRLSDISMGDFWGIAETRPHLDADKGTSLLFINSKKGKEFFELVKPALFFEECTFNEASNSNACIFEAPLANPRRDCFFRDLNNMPFDQLIRLYCRDSYSSKRELRLFSQNLKRRVVKVLKRK